MGGSFAEGIDVLGGRIQRAIIVGPALPVADTVQRARMDRLEDLNPASAYDQICRKPAIIRIQQAVGRMVRAPGQHAQFYFTASVSQKEYSTLFCLKRPTKSTAKKIFIRGFQVVNMGYKAHSSWAAF